MYYVDIKFKMEGGKNSGFQEKLLSATVTTSSYLKGVNGCELVGVPKQVEA